MSRVASEEQQVRELLDRVEELEDIAASLPEQDERRVRLICVARDTLRDVGPVRPVVAARLLELNEKTVRAWSDEGVLLKTSESPRVLLDPEHVHRVWHLVRELRAAGKTRGMLDEVYRRLSDSALLDRPDLQESLDQMRRGEGTILVPRRPPAAQVPVEVRATRVAEAQINSLRGPSRKAFDRFRDELAAIGCDALQYRVTGEGIDKLCVRHLRGAWRVVVAFHPDENTAWIVLVGEHADDDPGRNVYDLLQDIVGHRLPSDQRRRKPPCCEEGGAAPDATEQMAELLAARTRDVLRGPRR